MTQEEIDLIYEYLHEHCIYKDGELIIIKTRPGGCFIGKSIGSFNHKRKGGNPILSCSITIDSKRYTVQLKHIIYLYHTKKWAKNILFKDGNPVNCKIENLEAQDKISKFILQKEQYGNKTGATPYHYQGKTRYRVRLSTNEGRFTIGSYNDEETAKKCYSFAKNKYLEKNLNNDEIKKLTLQKYPRNEHKKVKLKGVSLTKSGRYKALYIKDGFKKHIGTYDTDKEAHESYLDYKKMIENL